jgi:ankyrin repeat protein
MNTRDKRSGLAPLNAIVRSIQRQGSIKYTVEEIEESIDRHYKAAELLLDNGADVNVRDRYGLTPLEYCSDVRCAKFLLKYGADMNMGIRSLHSEVLKQLIANGADVNARDSKGNTPLFQCNRATAEVLIKNGADVKIRNLKGETPLFSCYNGDEAMEFMIIRGADVNAKNLKGETALFYVEKPERVRLFAKYKIRVNEQDNEGRTALHYILNENSSNSIYRPTILKTILALLANDADVDIKDKDGITPLDIARDIANRYERYSSLFGEEFYNTMLKYKK